MIDPDTTSSPASAAGVRVAAIGVRPSTLWLATEFAGLFVLLPLLVRWRLLQGPRLLVLVTVTMICIGLLWKDPTFDRSRLFSLGEIRSSLKSIALRALLVGGVITALVLLLRPIAFLSLPTQAPHLWLALLVLYPIMSAWPQEVVFRLFFFHRYTPLFGTGTWLVGANAVAFAFLHLIYPNVLAALCSLPGGLLLALTYRRTRTLGPVWIEHTIYGLLIFTLGLGGYFYDGRQ
jgi:membrane protease YdiL (CAAX protease family)